MSNILPFKKKSPSNKKRATNKNNLMCRNNHHKWSVVNEQRFDVKQGKLVTLERCSRCGKTRNRLS